MSKSKLILLAEECCELGAIAMKSEWFGVDSKHPETGISNEDALVQEIADVLVAAKLVCMEHGFIEDGSLNDAINRKIKNLETFRGIDCTGVMP